MNWKQLWEQRCQEEDGVPRFKYIGQFWEWLEANFHPPIPKTEGPYFAKYLPVEGEIKQGDNYIDPEHGHDDVLTRTLGTDDESYKSCKKVKLFLCSRDYKIGDRVKIDVLLNGIYNDFTFKEEGEEDGIKYQTFEGTGIYNRYPEHDKELNIFRVLGEISPDATWVKEGDEFGEDEVKMEERCEECRGTQGAQAWCGCTNKNIIFSSIKGPCGRFH